MSTADIFLFMPKTREQKEQIVKELEKEIADHKAMVFIDFSNIDSPSLFDLRGRLKESGCSLKIIKKTLLEKTLENMKMNDLLDKVKQVKSQLALVFGYDDEIIPNKICYEMSKENENLEILGAYIDNEYLEQDKVLELAKLPSKAELLGRLVATLNNPVSSFVHVLENNIKGLFNVLKAIK